MSPNNQPKVSYGSDIIVDVLLEAGISHFAFNPGATIRGLHESLVYFREQVGQPSILLCSHEEIAVALAHGYTKASGKVMAVGLHNVVGLTHAAMAIFNAWCDRVPIVLIGGTGPMRQSRRRPHIDWIHTAYLQGDLVRQFVKWDAQVFGTESIASFLRRGIDTARLAPHGPVYLCFDVEDQEASTDAVELDSGTGVESHAPVAVSDETLQWVAERLSGAEQPVILADHYNVFSQAEPISQLAELAERFAVPVIDLGGRLNMPTSSPYCRTVDKDHLLETADLILALDCRDLYGALRSRNGQRQRGPHTRIVRSDSVIVSVSEENVPRGSWVPEGSPPERVDLQVPTPGLTMVESLLALTAPDAGSDLREGRRTWMRERASLERSDLHEKVKDEWNAVPISTSRIAHELGVALENTPSILANFSFITLPLRLWSFDGERLTHLGKSGGEGLGYGLPASVGAALAAKESGRIAVNIQGDGDFLFVPSALWTAVAYELPLLIVVHNNQAYQQDAIHQRTMSRDRGRGNESVTVGIEIDEPAVDFAGLAASYGCWSAGPINDPDDLSAVFKEAVEYVTSNSKPAVVDVISAAR